MTYQIILCDIDGVLLTPHQMFSYRYAHQHGFQGEELQSFFETDSFLQAMRGQLSIQEAIMQHKALWHIQNDIDPAMQAWLGPEDEFINRPLLHLMGTLRHSGAECYAVTNQERLRSHYLQSKIFANVFDGWFVSCDIGLLKSEPAFFKHVFRQLQKHHAHLLPQQIAFIDDSDHHSDSAKTAGFTVHKYRTIQGVQAFLGL